MNNKAEMNEIVKFLELLKKLTPEQQRELYYMIKGAELTLKTS